MKLKNILPIFVLGFAVIAMSSCNKDKYGVTYTYKTNKAVYMTYEDLRSSVKSDDAQDLKKPGKIYMKDDYLFVNEVKKGIHVINNTNPSNPVKESFINVPGIKDITIVGNTLYADSYIDFVTIDISDVKNVQEISRKEHVFPYEETLDMEVEWGENYEYDTTKGVVTHWEKVIISETFTNADDRPETQEWLKGKQAESEAADNSTGKSGTSTGSASDVYWGGTGSGGSMSRFATKCDILYVLTNSNLISFDISNPGSAGEVNRQYVGWNVETIFPHEDKLYIGGQTGMHIYDVSACENPSLISTYDHVTSCDPVIVDGDYAYVTIRSGTDCRWGTNMLDVVDISDPYNPTEVSSTGMSNPHGLAKAGNNLFVCDGNNGLKVFDVSDPTEITTKKNSFPDINAFDVIADRKHSNLIMIGEDGLYQYDYSDIDNIKQLSVIPVVSTE